MNVRQYGVLISRTFADPGQGAYDVYDTPRGKIFEQLHRWNCGVQLRQNLFGTYTRLKENFAKII